MKNLTNIIDNVVSHGNHIIRIVEIQRQVVREKDALDLLSIDGSHPKSGEYIFARIDILIPILTK